MPRSDEDRPRTGPAIRPTTRWRGAIVLLALALACICILIDRSRDGAARTVSEAATSRLACVSYAPFRRPGETPFDPDAMVSPERIAADLRELAKLSRCVRTYSVDQGLDAVPEIAHGLGMRVLLGAWIGRDAAKNTLELTRAIALANRHRDTVDALIVGNEVLLRREQPVEVLAQYLEQARAASSVPVTYADVWEFWLRNTALAEHVDLVTIHVLPYWEDEPVAVDQAVAHVLAIAAQVRQRMPGHRLLIGETGWPSVGRQRDGAIPSRVNQAEFVRRFVGAAANASIDYNLIEAFDQPWKRELEGAMGGYWGVLDSDAQAKFPWQGPVAENPDARHGLVAAAMGAALGLLLGFAARLGLAGTLGATLLLASGACMLVAQWEYMGWWNRNPLEWMVSGIWTAIGVILCALAALRIGQRLGDRPLLGVPSFARAIAAPRRGASALSIARMLVLAGACVMTLLLVADARYRGFPTPLYLMPVISLAALSWLGDRPPGAAAEERLLTLLLAGLGMAMLCLEGPENRQAIGFGALMLVLALACWPRAGGPGRRAQRRASTATETTSAAAPGSAE